jgi:branched-subunit amino acid aminotransferase/4-amino-4-deoxychorismate lyase
MSRSVPPHHPAGSERGGRAATRAIAWTGGRVVPASEASIPMTDDGFLRGDAVFDAMLVRRGHTHARNQHLERLRRSADVLDIRIPDLSSVITDLLVAWGEKDGVLRVYVTRGGNVRGLLGASTWPAEERLMAVETPWKHALTGVKTVSYAVNQWATRQAVKRGADDALVVDDGRVLELPTAAICLVHGDTVQSPDHERVPVLDSITLAELRKVAEVAATTPTLDDVRTADEMFVVSAARPVIPVHSVLVGGDELSFPSPGPVTKRLRTAFDEHIAATLDPRG